MKAMSIPPVPPGGIPKFPEGESDKEQAISQATNLFELIQKIKDDIQKNAPHSTLEEEIQKLEKHFDALKELVSHKSFHESFDSSLLELNAELIKIKSNFGKDEKGMTNICSDMQTNLLELIDHLKTL